MTITKISQDEWERSSRHFGEVQGWTMSEQQHAKTVALLSALAKEGAL